RVGHRLFARRAERRAVVTALRSSCARPKMVRCCLYSGPADALGRCRIMRPATCEASGNSADLGPGSCMPAPCGRWPRGGSDPRAPGTLRPTVVCPEDFPLRQFGDRTGGRCAPWVLILEARGRDEAELMFTGCPGK